MVRNSPNILMLTYSDVPFIIGSVKGIKIHDKYTHTMKGIKNNESKGNQKDIRTEVFI